MIKVLSNIQRKCCFFITTKSEKRNLDKTTIGLYRDHGLGVFEKLYGPQIEQVKNKSLKIFKDCGLSITLKSNATSVDFLGVTLNL